MNHTYYTHPTHTHTHHTHTTHHTPHARTPHTPHTLHTHTTYTPHIRPTPHTHTTCTHTIHPFPSACLWAALLALPVVKSSPSSPSHAIAHNLKDTLSRSHGANLRAGPDWPCLVTCPALPQSLHMGRWSSVTGPGRSHAYADETRGPVIDSASKTVSVRVCGVVCERVCGVCVCVWCGV